MNGAAAPVVTTLWLVHAWGDSSRAFEPLLASDLQSSHGLRAPDWPGAGSAPADPKISSLDSLGGWLARTIELESPGGPIGLVGHSLGAAVAVKAAHRLGNVVGVFSIEGNLTEADAYFSGLAARFEDPEAFRDHLRDRVRALAESAGRGGSEALWRYHANLARASAPPLWAIGRSARTASRLDGLGDEYRALRVPTLYFWSPQNAPPRTQEYVREHRLPNVEFAGGHWPMVDQPAETASRIDAFFRPLFSAALRAAAP